MATIDVMISEEEIAKKVEELAKQIEKDYEGEQLLVVGILKGASVFVSDLIRKINLDVNIEYKEYKNDYTTLTDSQLNEVYSAILDIPELKLNSDHIESLKKRGLTESEIDIFGYRTMPEYLYFPKGKDWSFKLWDRSNFEDIYFRFLNLKK